MITKTKAYLASQYPRRNELRIYVDMLESVGIEITSRWLDESEPLESEMGEHSEEFYTRTAAIDLEDVDKSDILIFFAESPLVGIKRGGRHVEFGYALAKGKTIHVIKYKENVFHYMPNVIHHKNIHEFIKWFKNNHVNERKFVKKEFTTRRRCGSRRIES